jgi:Lrp/AsnC family transcriptional regulator, leucine-responsive regulatory protein
MIDPADVTILEALQKQARVKQSELAEMTGLSIPTIGERLKKLEEAKIIRAYATALEPRSLGFDVAAFIAVTVDSSKHFKSFLAHVHGEDEVQECHAVTGKGTHLIKVRTRTTASLEKLLSRIQSWEGVTQTMTSVVLSSPKETTYLPLATKRR